MKQPLSVLHIEDSPEDSELIHELLKKEGLFCEFKRVETRSAVFDELQNNSFDLILSDCKLPGFSGMGALQIAHALTPDVPFVFVSGTIGEETAIESLRNGATDYVLKDHMSRLAPAVRRAMSEAQERTLCRQLQQRLREAGRLEAVSTLSNGIGHDFNNILTIILGHASLLTMEYDRPDRVLEITETITQAAKRASDVVQQLLAFSHSSDGRGVSLDLNRRVQETLSQARESCPTNITLHFEPGVSLPHVVGHSSQIDRIIANLVSNACDSMPEGGRVTITSRLVPAVEVPDLLPELGTKHYIRLQIADCGVGMDAATREHIFEPFFTTKERSRGTGLGLAVVYGLMQSHHGSIHIESEPGAGTTVSLYFPVPIQITKTGIVSHLSNPQLRGSESVLVIEDEADVSFYLETVLKSHGYQVLVAHDHEQATELFNAHAREIQLIFSDVGLPKVDGITLCSRLKKLAPDVRIILSSGYSPTEFQNRMDTLGIEAFIPKPYVTRDLLTRVRSVLDRKTTTRTPAPISA